MGFIRIADWAEALADRGLDEAIAIQAVDARLVPTYLEQDELQIWEDDLAAVPSTWVSMAAPGQLPFAVGSEESNSGIPIWNLIGFRNGIEVTLPPSSLQKGTPALIPALRVLAGIDTKICGNQPCEVEWIGGIRVRVPHTNFLPIIGKLSERMNRVSTDHAPELTKSAYYMGSKYSISPYLVEGIANVLPPDGVVVDLMCGSGAATRAFSLNWEVLASDAMNFCSCLASSYGKQSGDKSALEALPQIHSYFQKNMELLKVPAEDLLQTEQELLYSPLDIEGGLRDHYAKFIDTTPRFPEGGSSRGWFPRNEVIRRQAPGHLNDAPYCLILSYFGNVYFGLRQAMELDSLRYAIDQLEDKNIRRTALAALVTTASYLGTGYASQFAQPVNIKGLSRRSLFNLLERRAISVFPEFVARMTALVGVAVEAIHSVSSFKGTWEDSLTRIPSFAKGRPVCVYLDAPYTRDEYARYYHVLETLCNYHYPDSIGRGRVPNRKLGQIFRSPFFTRTDSAIAPLLSDVITNSLRYADYCAWSYSSRARASIPEVVRSVIDNGGELVETFSIGHRYNGQGRSDRRLKALANVEEYLLIFKRNNILAMTEFNLF